MLTYFRWLTVCLGDPTEEPVAEVMSRWSLIELVDDKKADEIVAMVTKTIEQKK